MEHIRTPKVDNVRLLDRFNARKPAVGTLYLTATHLIFVDPTGKKETWILHTHIASVEKQPLTTAGSPLLIRCKTFLCVTFIIPRERDCHDIHQSLTRLSHPASLEELYAFHYTAPDISDKTQCWDLFDIHSEFMRMGVPNKHWVLSVINKDYEMCDTYPQHLFVPSSASTPILLGSARFRSRGRLPVLSYWHRANQATICRCSQPLAGFSARCVEDEQMLQAILKSNPNSKFMFVVDTRPKINAMANRAAGKGYENENFYTNIKFQFLGIENIHVMRNSLQKLVEVCELKNPSMAAFLSSLESSGWLKHIKAIIDTSHFIARAVTEGISVLVHCSDGWDRTAQTCSLAGLLLDPYYRTIEGLQILIEKEWLSFGHKFTDRCGFIGTVDTKETSPVFTQFIDSVWQLLQQFPAAFEFNERFLLTLHDHLHSSQFGTFIGNCEKDRIDLRLRERTYSLWAYLAKYRNDYINPYYNKEAQLRKPVLEPSTSPQAYKFWRGMYNRFENGVHPRENLLDIASAAKDHTSSLSQHMRLLEKRITSLCRLLGREPDETERTLQCLTSTISMDFSVLILNQGSQNQSENSSPEENHGLRELAERESKHSDSESGFEDGPQLTKSIAGASPEHRPPLKDDDIDPLVPENMLKELQSVAVDWKSFRNVKQCGCAMPFEHFNKKYHCWKCGDVYCTRCIDRLMQLPGHEDPHAVPVCKACYRQLKHSPSPSITDLQHELM